VTVPTCQCPPSRRTFRRPIRIRQRRGRHPEPHCFPPRRSSDLARENTPVGFTDRFGAFGDGLQAFSWPVVAVHGPIRPRLPSGRDRKSTRLNSSHVKISYAVFCLKKKNTDITP